MSRILRRDDEPGVSSVLGAILVFGLLVITLTVIQVEFVPVWDKQRERDQSIKVAGQANAIKADLDRIAAGQVDDTLSEPISLVRSRGFTFFGSEVIPGTVRYTPTSSGAGLEVNSSNPVAFQQSSGESLFGLNEDWSWNGTAIFNILDIVHLRLRIPNPGGLPNGTQTFTMTLTDVNGMCAGQLQVVATGTTLVSKNLELRVLPASVPANSTCSTTPIDIQETFMGTTSPTYYYEDPLEDSEFGAVLAAVTPNQYPLSASFTQGNTASQVALVYDQNTAFGRVRSGASGLLFQTLSQSFQTGTLSIGLNHQRLPPQTFAFEYGAVILEQPQGAAMVAAPGFTVSTSLTQAALAWAFPVLTGGSSAVSGAPGATVSMSPNGDAGMQFAAQDITVQIDTAYPTAWASFWNERMALAGLSSTAVTPQAPCAVLTAAPQYAVNTTATTATLTFRGPCSHPTDTTRDVVVTVLAGGASITLQPAG